MRTPDPVLVETTPNAATAVETLMRLLMPPDGDRVHIGLWTTITVRRD
jgi:hypothetical protein